MFACICQAVTVEEVVRAVDAGADSVEAVGRATRAGTCCATCHDHIEDIVAERCGPCPLAALSA